MVIVGADAGGMSAATNARRGRDAEDLEIVAFDRGNYSSYSACGIPYFVGGVVPEIDALVARTPEQFASRTAIDVRVRHEVTAIDLDRRAIHVRAVDDGREAWEPFDHLVVATGATPIRPALSGIDATGIFPVHTLDDASAIRHFVEEQQPARAVVVGGGYISLEMAEALGVLGIETHLVEIAAQPMGTLDPDMGALVAEGLREFGTTVHLGTGVTGFDTDAGAVRAVVTADGSIPTDLVLLGLGVRPNTALAAAAGLTIGESRAIEVDDHMRTSAEGVWSAGDCAEKLHRVSGRPVAIALGTHANKQGRVAGVNIGGGDAAFPGVVGTAVTKVCALEVARTGLTELDAAVAGFRTETFTHRATTRAGYYPGAAPITTKLIVEAGTGRLLGGQIVGREGAAKRIDVLATALWNEMTVDELQNVDLSYAPPYSPVWDPILGAARQAAAGRRD